MEKGRLEPPDVRSHGNFPFCHLILSMPGSGADSRRSRKRGRAEERASPEWGADSLPLPVGCQLDLQAFLGLVDEDVCARVVARDPVSGRKDGCPQTVRWAPSVPSGFSKEL